MLLKNIINGTIQTEVLLIKDDVYTSGLYVLKEVLDGFIQRNGKIHHFSYEKHNTPYIEQNSQVKVYDCFRSSCPWFKHNASQNNDIYLVAETFMKDIPTNQQIFVVNSLACVLLRDEISKLNRLIEKLTSVKYKSGLPAFPVVMILHDFDDDVLWHRQSESMCNVVLKIERGKKRNHLKLSAGHKKGSGKFVKENYLCWLDPETKKFCFQEVKEVEKPIQPIQQPNETNMAELTTFKLTLEEREKESRNKLVLPFMRRQEEKGQIFYEPDANDDWDEEDPDDDLEI